LADEGGTELDGAGDLAFLAKRAEARFLSAPHMVENTLRQAIVDGVLVGGQKLRQFELAAAFGVSRVPVREALRTLEAEGFLQFIHNRGVVVSGLSLEELEEVYAMRVGLEALAARLGAERADGKTLRNMGLALDHMRAAARDSGGDMNEFLNADLNFHAAHYLASGRASLWNRILQLRRSGERYIRQSWRLPRALERTLRTHGQLLNACRARNGTLAANIVRKDLEQTAQELMTFFRKKDQRKG
jgi:DNA-binding GntR family transcriptional regulator